jgi:dipeptidyl aminopeptidase/acylaminoacyl peptidase
MQRRVWVMRRDGSQPRRLTSAPGYRDERPQWSSDGSRILFARIHAADPHDAAADRAEIWLMYADGRAAEPVVRDLSIRQEASSGAAHLMWFGYYGHIDWELAYDWWRPARPRQCARALGDAALSAVAAARAGC